MKEDRKSEQNDKPLSISHLPGQRESAFYARPPEIEGYEIIDKLGESGQAQIWRAVQLSTHRQVALKVPKIGLLSYEKVLARFEREVELAARLKHPNIACIHDRGIRQGLYYCAMDLIEGTHLDVYVKDHNLTKQEILKLMRTVCQAVQYAHQNGVIHRDLKPSNIMVTEEGQPYIVDFGLAKSLLESDLALTVSGGDEAAGTPAYMSPEQAAGHTDKVDTRTDVYSLGVTLFVLLTGSNPHDLSGSRLEVLRRIVDQEVRRPRTLNRNIDKDIEALLLKALDKDPDRRYSSAAGLTEDIDNYLRGAPLIAGPPGTGYRLKKFIRRNRAMVTAMTACLAMLMTGIVVSVVLAFGQARARAAAEAVSDFLQNTVLASLDPDRVEDRQITVRSILDAASKDLEGKFQGTPMVEAEIRHTIGFAYWSLGLYEQHELHCGRAVDICRVQLGDEHAKTLLWMKELGWGYFNQSRFEEAEKLFSEAVEGMRRGLGEEHRYTPQAMVSLGCVYYMLGRFNDAEKLLLEAYEITQNKLDKEYSDLVGLLNMLGWGYTVEGRYTEAERLFTEGWEISQRELGKRNWHVLHLMHHYGELYLDLGRYKEAEDMLLETLARRSHSCGPEHPDTLQTMSILGHLYHRQGRYKEAESLLLETLEIARTSAGDEYICTLGAMYWLAELYLTLERVDEAEPLLLEVSDILCRILGEENWMTLKVRSTLAQLYAGQGRYAEAEKLYLKTLVAQRQALGDDHPDTLATVNGLAMLRMQQGCFDDANDLFCQSLDGRTNKLGDDHPVTLESKKDLSMLYIEQGNYIKAEPLLLEAVKGRRLKLGDTHPDTIESWKNLIALYDAWNKPGKAEKWRAQLAQIKDFEE